MVHGASPTVLLGVKSTPSLNTIFYIYLKAAESIAQWSECVLPAGRQKYVH